MCSRRRQGNEPDAGLSRFDLDECCQCDVSDNDFMRGRGREYVDRTAVMMRVVLGFDVRDIVGVPAFRFGQMRVNKRSLAMILVVNVDEGSIGPGKNQRKYRKAAEDASHGQHCGRLIRSSQYEAAKGSGSV